MTELSTRAEKLLTEIGALVTDIEKASRALTFYEPKDPAREPGLREAAHCFDKAGSKLEDIQGHLTDDWLPILRRGEEHEREAEALEPGEPELPFPVRRAAAILLGLLFIGPAQAQDAPPPICAPYAEVTGLLRSGYHEERRWAGVAGRGRALVELWVSGDGTWTIIEVAPDNTTCLQRSGIGSDPLLAAGRAL